MPTARSFVPLAILGGFLWAAAPVLSFDRGPSSQQHPTAPQKQAPKSPPPAANQPNANQPNANQPNDDRIVKKETRMKQRDKEIDKRLKQHVVTTR
jgi:flagellar basal body-associated protein FliL